ncbi:hypothetical protein AB6A40_010177 [Gnathostoma spinigerum]|uniref:Acetyl-coenzyme A transporter 1 n=1 Tax=Gnathostoma spinigerum TaxID=75299 RepID=A0ABD6EU35_9BILA
MTKIEFDLETTTTTDNHTSITSDRIRRRRNERESLDESEERCSSSLARLIANEAQLDSSRTGPVIPFLYRFGGTLKRIASSNAFLSSFMPVSDEDEEAGPRVTLIPHEKHYDEEQAADKNWIQRAYHSLHGDFASMGLLLFLYLLQGIPLGLIAAIPLVLQSKNVSYAEQAVFSFAHWPFSLKLFWAPIVDSVYCKRLGRRKSWMVPCQYLIGIFLVLLSYKVSNFMGENEPHSKPNVLFLMLVFLPLNFLAATQDIAVDGWALTMLSRKNVGYASTCNAVGQTAGFFMGNVVYLTLDSPEFANRFFRVKPQPYGLVTLSG